MTTYYHITKRQHLPSIFTAGLLPGHRVGLTVKTPRKVGKVFVTNDLAHIARYHAGEQWMKHWDAVVLAVELEPHEIEPVRYYDAGTYTLSNFEFTTNKVAPQRLDFVGSVTEVLAT